MSLKFLESVAPEFGATLKTSSPERLEVDLRIARPGGASENIALIVVGSELGPQVREAKPRRFPAACLERHINHDGSFCLAWRGGKDGQITCEQEARDFWSKVERFLNGQLAASKTRRWPGRQNARAHGGAAAHQDAAEKICQRLGDDMLRDLRRGKVVVKVDNTWRKERLVLLRHGRKIARTLRGKKTPLWVSNVCPCGTSSLPATSCSDHSELLAALSEAIFKWHAEHDAYVRFAARSGETCCGTMEHCELRDAAK